MKRRQAIAGGWRMFNPSGSYVAPKEEIIIQRHYVPMTVPVFGYSKALGELHPFLPGVLPLYSAPLMCCWHLQQRTQNPPLCSPRIKPVTQPSDTQCRMTDSPQEAGAQLCPDPQQLYDLTSKPVPSVR